MTERKIYIISSTNQSFLRKDLEIRREESRNYISWRETLAKQKLTRALYETTENDGKRLKQEMEETNQNLHQEKQQKQQYSAEIAGLEKEIRELERKSAHLTNQSTMLEDLVHAYSEYVADKAREKECRNAEERLKRQLVQITEEEENLRTTEIELQRQKMILENDCKGIRNALSEYEGYSPAKRPKNYDLSITQNLTLALARYKAITEKLSGEMTLLERELKEATNRLRKTEDSLAREAGKHGFIEKEWISVSYSEQEEEHRRAANNYSKRAEIYKAAMDRFSAFEGYALTAPVTWTDNFDTFSPAELRSYGSALLKAYENCSSAITKEREKVAAILNQILRMELFKDEYFKRPLENLLTVPDSADNVVKQLDIIQQSFHLRLEKLMVDLGFVAQDREEIINQLRTYIYNVHTQMGLIDKNST